MEASDKEYTHDLDLTSIIPSDVMMKPTKPCGVISKPDFIKRVHS
jgi:hypothetical protein